MSRMTQRVTPIGLAVLAVLVLAPDALAHKMLAVARVREDGTVRLQAVFPDGKPARGVKVEVRRPNGDLFTEGETDERGELTIQPDGPPGRWSAVFTGSMGHRLETTFSVEGATPERTAPVARDAANREDEGEASPQPDPEPSEAEPVPWTRVLAGLGFVFGLAAFLMCLKFRADLRRHLTDDADGGE
ncbi:MAG: hypothetical protein R6X33_15765 [Candidatus Brocadiia bacterium]